MHEKDRRHRRAVGLGSWPVGRSFLCRLHLTILHINDWHSRIESNNKFESTCSAEEERKGECIGGAARLVTAIAAERKKLEGQNVLLLNGGDNFQGSLFYTTYKGAAEAEFLNQMKFDAMTVGNHEFDDGEDALAPFLDVVKFPVLSANVKASAASKVGDRIKPSLVLDVGGQKIGIVGAVTTDTPEIASPGPNITIEDDIATITAEVEKLKGQGVNKIIALTHVGYPRDKEMIAKIPGVDVVVGGHSHSLLSNTDAKAEGPYPTMIDNPEGYKVPVTQAASYSKYLGEFTVTFDDNGVVKEAKGDPIFLDKSITPDAGVLARIKELGAPIEELKTKEVSETTAPIDGSREICRARECEMGNLVADAMLDRVKDQGVTIVFQNGGGMRASIDQGVVTMGEVLTVLPFQNTLATFQLTGKDIVASLEHGVSMIEEGKGAFPQVAGPEIFLRQVGRAERRPHQVGRGDGERRLGADRRGQALHRRHQQFHARRRRRLQAVRRQCPECLRLRPGPGAGGRRLSDREPALYAEARRAHHRDRSRRTPQPRKPAAPARGCCDTGSGACHACAARRLGRHRRNAADGRRSTCRAAPAEATASRSGGRHAHDRRRRHAVGHRRRRSMATAPSGRRSPTPIRASTPNDLPVGSTLKIPPAS